MSREPTKEELGTLAKIFATWICDKGHGVLLETAINAAFSTYKAQRIQRKHPVGAPTPVEEEPSLFLPDDAVTESSSVVVDKAVQFISSATNIAINRFRLATAYVAENTFTDRVTEFYERFGTLTAENAALAFFDIGNAQGGWEIDGHEKVGRGSLKTLTLAYVFDAFVTNDLRINEKDFTAMPDENSDAADTVLVDWASETMRHLGACLQYYDAKAFDLRYIPHQAELLFSSLVSTAPAQIAFIELGKYYEAMKAAQPKI